MKFSLLIVFLVFFLCGCAQKNIALKDLEYYPQNSGAYIHNIESKSALLDIQNHYKEHYFQPWNITEVPLSKLEAMWALYKYEAGQYYGENLLLLDEAWFNAMEDQSNFDAYGTLNHYAITLHFTHLRAFPTHKPLFSDPSTAGEGFPFDYMQNSGIHSNEPLFISHYSKDGAWVYVFTSYASGWVRKRDIALLTHEETQAYQQHKFLHVKNEYVPLKNSNGDFMTYGRVGMFLPFIKEELSNYSVLIYDQHEGLIEAILPSESATKEYLLLNRKNLLELSNKFIGKKYGWGGLYEERDCSSTLRDLYAAFGIWLPRNSSKQAKIGEIVSLKDLSDTEKILRIKNKAVPFETLLYRPGHVLLYLGTYNDMIMVFHNTWGIRTIQNGIPGRKIIGKTVISTLKLGQEQPDYDEKYEHLRNIESMNIITR